MQAYVTKQLGFEIASEVIPRPKCGPTDVLIEMLVSGLCRTDLAMASNEIGASKYPMVAGHEGIGRIVEVGSAVKRRKVGQHVGLGWMRGACTTCRQCQAARENVCSTMTSEAVGAMTTMNGTFAEFCVSPEKFAIPIPDGLDIMGAAPLVCAGITVWNPLCTYATHMSRVLIVSMGGLGGLAVQFAAKMGCDVVAMSRGTKKKPQAIAMGARSYIDSTNEEQLKAEAGTFDLILDTSPATGDMSIHLPLLGPQGRYATVGVAGDGKKMQVGNSDVLFMQSGVVGSMFGSISQIEDMMIFAARHGIVADYEVMPMGKLGEAMEKLDKGENKKMRIVLVREDKFDAYEESTKASSDFSPPSRQ